MQQRAAGYLPSVHADEPYPRSRQVGSSSAITDYFLRIRASFPSLRAGGFRWDCSHETIGPPWNFIHLARIVIGHDLRKSVRQLFVIERQQELFGVREP